MNLFVWKIWLAMKLILCIAALCAIYLIETNAAPATAAQENERGLSANLIDNLGVDGQIELQRRKRHSSDMDDQYVSAVEEAVSIETKKKKHPPAAKPTSDPAASAHEKPAHEKPAHEKPAHEKPAHEKPVHEKPEHEKPEHEKPDPEKPKPPPKQPPKTDAQKPEPPKAQPPKQEEYQANEVPVHHFQHQSYQFQDLPSEYHSYQQHHYQQNHYVPEHYQPQHYQPQPYPHQHIAPQHIYSNPTGSYREMDEQDSLGSALSEYQPSSIDYAQPPATCSQNVVAGCTPVVQFVPCSGHESHPYAEEHLPAYPPEPEAPFYREDLPETQNIEPAPAFVASQKQNVGSLSTEPAAKMKVPTQQYAATSVDKSAHSANANLIDSDAKEVIIHADTTSTTEKVSEIKPSLAPIKIPSKSLTPKKMEEMRKMAKNFNVLTQRVLQTLPALPKLPQPNPAQPAQILPAQAQPVQAQPVMPQVPSPVQMIHTSQIMPESHQHMVGAPQMIGSNSAGGSPTQSLHYQDYQYN